MLSCYFFVFTFGSDGYLCTLKAKRTLKLQENDTPVSVVC